MSVNEIFTSKKSSKAELLKKYGFSRKKVIGFVSLDKSIITEDFLDGLSILDVNFIIKSDKGLNSKYKNITFISSDIKDILGLDFVLCGDCEGQMTKYFASGVAPIASKTNVVSPLLSEFNPGKVTGNAYLYENNNKWDIFHGLTRYLENFKFTYDNKALVKNVLEI